MNETELAALTALVEQETLLMAGENATRLVGDFSPTYAGDNFQSYAVALHKELERRGVLNE